MIDGNLKPEREWVGAHLVVPFYVQDGEVCHRPDAVVWAAPAADRIVGFEMLEPDGAELSVGGTLVEALEHAHDAGGPPTRIRVANRKLAQIVRRVTDVPITVGPTPEIVEILHRLLQREIRPVAEWSHFAGGVSADAVRELYEATAAFFRMAPWRLLRDGVVLRLDEPRAGVRGVTLEVFGSRGNVRGIRIHPSAADRDAYRAATRRRRPRAEPYRRASALSLTYVRASDLPTRLRREVMAHGWPVASSRAYSLVEHVDDDGVRRQPDLREVYLLAQSARLLTAFLYRHGDRLRAHREVQCSEWYIDGYREAWLTIPADAETGIQRHERHKRGPGLRLALLSP